MKTKTKNNECKRCGLLKSTVEATNAKCIPDKRMGTVLEGVHDFPFVSKPTCEGCEKGIPTVEYRKDLTI